MFADIYILYLFSKYKLGFLEKKELIIGIREYVKNKGQVFIKLIQLFLMNQYKWEEDFTNEEFNEMNKILDQVYVDIPESDFNIGCGSVAYVYFNKNDKSKVIKKLIPNIHQQIESSINSFEKMLFIARVTGYDFINNVNINSYKKFLLKQTDLEQEGKNILQMRLNFVNIKNIYVPRVFTYSKEMIEMRYVKGEPINIFLKNYPEKKEECNKLLEKAIRNMINKQFLHGDLHDGNLLFYIYNDVVRLNIIDFGLVMTLTEKQKEIFTNFIFLDKPNHKIKFIYEISSQNTSYIEFKKKCYQDEFIHLFKNRKLNYKDIFSCLKKLNYSINIEYLNLFMTLCFLRIRFLY